MGGKTLTEQVLEWRAGRRSYLELVRAIVIAVWVRTSRLEEDDRSEFVCFFFNRIRGMVERYDPALGEFEAYLATCVRYQLKSYRRLMSKRRFRREAAYDPEFWRSTGRELTLYSEEVAEPEERPRRMLTAVSLLREAAHAYRLQNQRVHEAAFRRRLLYVALKCSLYASEESVREVAAFLEVDPGDLHRLTRELAKTLRPRVERRRSLRERQNELACIIHALRSELEQTVDPRRRMKLLRVLGIYEKRSRNLASIIDHIPQYVTNKEIAELLKVPKGSVDSGIFYVRTVLKRAHGSADRLEAGNYP